MLVFLSPISIFFTFIGDGLALSLIKISNHLNTRRVRYSDPHCIMHWKEKEKITREHDIILLDKSNYTIFMYTLNSAIPCNDIIAC